MSRGEEAERAELEEELSGERGVLYLEEAELLAGVEDGPADLVAGAGEVDDGERDGGGGRRRALVGREDEAVRERLVGRRRGQQLVLHRALSLSPSLRRCARDEWANRAWSERDRGAQVRRQSKAETDKLEEHEGRKKNSLKGRKKQMCTGLFLIGPLGPNTLRGQQHSRCFVWASLLRWAPRVQPTC
jgi:hypothetical protein